MRIYDLVARESGDRTEWTLSEQQTDEKAVVFGTLPTGTPDEAVQWAASSSFDLHEPDSTPVDGSVLSRHWRASLADPWDEE